MEEVKWTPEQLQAIEEKGENILVAAGAGSGKTAVLVERIIQKIIKDKIDIDKILVVTFTNAAAAEMRERILEAIYKKLEKEPDNEHLQKQIVLLGKANISTIDSFCLDIIKNNFYELDIAPNCRIGDETEIIIIKQETIEEVFEELYENEDKDFMKLLDIYEGYRTDDNLKELILKIYNYIQSSPFPEEWLNEKVEEFNISDDEEISETKWGQVIINEYKEIIEDGIKKLENILKASRRFVEMDKWNLILEADINEYNEILKQNNWNDLCSKSFSLNYIKWASDKKIDLDIKDVAKQVRDDVKESIKEAREKFLISNSEQINKDIRDMYKILDSIRNIVISFSNLFETKKRDKNIIDFNNIEHFALNILLKKDEEGNYAPTEVAKKYRDRYEEIAIDEYQDSNRVQE